MGFSQDIIYDMAMKDIRAAFPEYEGWQSRQIVKGKTNERGFLFSRRIQGNVESGIVWVSFSRGVTPEISEGFSEEDKKVPRRTRKVLLVPRSAVVPALPQEIRIMEMKSFGYDGDGKLVWLTKKKNARNYSLNPANET
jgi:hypothetical protein